MNRARSLVAIVVLVGTACGSNADPEANDTASETPTATADQAPNDTPNDTANDTPTATADQTPNAVNQTAATADVESDAADPGAGADVAEALRFRAPLVGGGEIDMATLADQPVVLWFWAPY